MTHRQIEHFLSELRESHAAMRDVFKCGSCYHLFCVLRALEPSARPWYKQNPGHVYSEIGGRFYDIEGSHVFTAAQRDSLRPLFSSDRRPDRWRDKAIREVEAREFGPMRKHYTIQLTWWFALLLHWRKWLHPMRYRRYKQERIERMLDDTAWEMTT